MEKENETMSIKTMDEIIQECQKDLSDEIKDCRKYMHMSKQALLMNHEELARGFCEVAKDEYTHAHFLRETLHDFGIVIPEDIETCYMKLEKTIEHEDWF